MTLAYTPAYPVPGDTVTLSVTGPSAPGSNRQEYEITSVPSRSTITPGRILDLNGDPTDEFVPDVAGQYGIRVYEYRESGYAPPRYPNDAIGASRLRLLANQSGFVNVSAVVSMPIATMRGHGSTLRLTINDGTVRAAELTLHANELSRIASAQSAVTTALDNLVGVAVSAIGNNIVTGVSDLRAKFEAHRVLVGGGPVHINADTTNAVQRFTSNATEYSIALLNELYSKILAHTQAGASVALPYHSNDDAVNVALVGTASNHGQATVLFADLAYRVYERHRVQTNSPLPAVHTTADNTNVVVAAAPLSLLIVAYLDAIAILDPTAPTGESEGANDAAHRYGFTLAP